MTDWKHASSRAGWAPYSDCCDRMVGGSATSASTVLLAFPPVADQHRGQAREGLAVLNSGAVEALS